jgi:transposase InsO family protein
MRWRIHQLGGDGGGACGSFHRIKGTTTVTPAEIIYHRRVRLLALAGELGNVSLACRQMGISRTRYYQWTAIVAEYGIDALMPKTRRAPQLPNATPTHIVEDLLTLAVIEPTIGCRQYADRLAERGYQVSKTTVQKLLVEHGLGRRAQRIARAAAITAATTGLTTDAARNNEPFGFCHYSPAPGYQVALDSFYIGNLKGVGKVYQLTAIDVATRWAIMLIVLGPVTTDHTIQCIDHVISSFRRLGVPVRAVLTDNGPEYIAAGFRSHLAVKGLEHVRIPPRSPNHNAVCERFQGTTLQECWRPAFHRRRFSSIRQLQAEADSWLTRYHHRRRNHSDYMRGRTPAQLLDNYRTQRAS